jgi:hypothetical protein
MRKRSGRVVETDLVQIGNGITEDQPEGKSSRPVPKNKAAAELGRKGGRKGGRVRAERLSPEERRASARKAALMRWAKPPMELTQSNEASGRPSLAEVSDASLHPPSPFAKFKGELSLGGTPIDCYVLDTGERVISLRAIVRTLTGIDASNLGDYIGVQALKPYINSDLVLGETRDFHIPGTQLRGRGILAERFIEILNGYVKALEAGALATDRQEEIAIKCSIVLGACAKVGLIALIDEATGYQYERAEDALQIKLKAFIADELREWEKTFPDELWEQFGRLTNWKGRLHQRPKWWGHLVIELIYEALDPDIARYLKENKPKPYHGQNYHQWFTQDIGLKALIPHIYEIIGIAKTCRDMKELRDKVAEHYGREPVQLTMYLPRVSFTQSQKK